ncbi:hypothetical protein FJY93_01725 [Candidatus Kaiserbacteria bacterium]|nr:hypothetical protein [Candidatus Kaiserbacteria bacterium]
MSITTEIQFLFSETQARYEKECSEYVSGRKKGLEDLKIEQQTLQKDLKTSRRKRFDCPFEQELHDRRRLEARKKIRKRLKDIGNEIACHEAFDENVEVEWTIPRRLLEKEVDDQYQKYRRRLTYQGEFLILKGEQGVLFFEGRYLYLVINFLPYDKYWVSEVRENPEEFSDSALEAIVRHKARKKVAQAA